MKDKRKKLQAKAQSLFKSWNEKATIRSGDSTGTIIKKIGLRIGGIIFITVASPVLLVVFIIVFLLVL